MNRVHQPRTLLVLGHNTGSASVREGEGWGDGRREVTPTPLCYLQPLQRNPIEFRSSEIANHAFDHGTPCGSYKEVSIRVAPTKNTLFCSRRARAAPETSTSPPVYPTKTKTQKDESRG